MIYLPNVRALDEAGNTDPVQWTSQSINQSINVLNFLKLTEMKRFLLATDYDS